MSEYLTDRAKVLGITSLIFAYTGEWPKVQNYKDYTEISLTPTQIDMTREVLYNFLSSDPGRIRINIKPVILPVIVKRYWKEAAIGLGTIFVLSKLLGGARK